MEENMIYDSKGDVLYLWFQDPEEVEEIVTEDKGDLLIKKNDSNGNIIGAAVIGFRGEIEGQVTEKEGLKV